MIGYVGYRFDIGDGRICYIKHNSRSLIKSGSMNDADLLLDMVLDLFYSN